MEKKDQGLVVFYQLDYIFGVELIKDFGLKLLLG